MMERRMKAMTEDDLKQAFSAFDRNGDGYISHAELKKMMKSLGHKLSDREVEAMIREIDVNNDGRISFKGRILSLSYAMP